MTLTKNMRALKHIFIFISILFVGMMLYGQNVEAAGQDYFYVDNWDTIHLEEDEAISIAYDGKDYYEVPRVFGFRDGGITGYELVNERDYIYSFYNGKTNEKVTEMKKVGTYKLVITGIGTWDGCSYVLEFEIWNPNMKSIAETTVEHEGDIGGKWMRYDGKNHNVVPVVYEMSGSERIYLRNGVDFTYAYYKNGVQVSDVIEEGEYNLVISGKGNYYETTTFRIQIEKDSIAYNDVEVWGRTYKNGEKESMEYWGEGAKEYYIPKVSGCVAGVDYIFEYFKDGKKVTKVKDRGTYNLKITGIGVYKGVINLTLKISEYKLSKYNIEINKEIYTYDMKKHAPKVKVVAYETLKKGKDYTISSIKKKKEIGENTITIKGRGNYKGTVKVKWKIVPKKVSYKVSTSDNKIFITPKKQTNITGYQIEYGLKNEWKYGLTEKTTLKQIQDTKTLPTEYINGAKVYFRVRAYKKVKGKNIYGSWTKRKAIRVVGPVKYYYY